jgi:predicted dehydrogenase
LAGEAGGLLGFALNSIVEFGEIEVHLAGEDFFFGGAVEAKLAEVNGIGINAEGRTEGAAGEGTVVVEIAFAGVGIERGTEIVVTEIFEPRLRLGIFGEDAGDRVAGKIGEVDGMGAVGDLGGAVGIGASEFGESVAQAEGIGLGDWENADATLAATGTAGEPCAAALRGVNQGGIDDIDQLVFRVTRHATRIAAIEYVFMNPHNRREMLKTLGVAVTGGYLATQRGYAANETIRVGCIGTGGRCQALMHALVQIPGAKIVTLCDVWDQALASALKIAPGATTVKDYRTVLDRKDIDAVLIASPNHQHVAMLKAACSAGKDVYVEKPLTHHLDEGPAALAAQNSHKRIVQVGMQQRSMPQFQRAYEIVKSGQLGKIRKVHLTWNRNAARGSAKYNIDPATVDWKAWLGPAREQPFDAYRFREWRWFWDFGGGVFDDLMVHYVDIAHWYLGVEHPTTAVSIGDKFSREEWETPDTAQTLLQYHATDGTSVAQVYFESTFMNARNGAMLEFMGSEGTLYLDRGRFEVLPEKRRDAHNKNAALPTVPEMDFVLGSGPRGADFYDEPDGELVHLSNWLDCVRTRKTPNAPVEAGISAASAAHMGNLALRGNGVANWKEHGAGSGMV